MSRFNNESEWELYDLEADRTEMNNLATVQPGKLSELIDMYEAWATHAHVATWESWEKGG